jgi:hypothetical protein
MSEIAESILTAYGRDLDPESRAKTIRYLEMLSSTGQRNIQELRAYGLAYLENLHNPDPRYTGC